AHCHTPVSTVHRPMTDSTVTTVPHRPLPSHAFKAYDIRGVVPDVIDEAFARALGHAFGARARAAGERTVAVGRDGRLSSPALAAALIDGLSMAGVDVLDIGMVTTPMLYFAAATHCR